MADRWLLALLAPCLLLAAPASLPLGFVFPMLSEGAPASQLELQVLPAFRLAVADLNNKSSTDILPSTTLLVAAGDSRSTYTGALGAALDLSTTVFGGTGMAAAIGDESTMTAVAMQSVFGNLDTLQVGYATGNDLSNPVSSPTYVSTVPLDSTDGLVIADLIGSSWLRLHRVVVFYSTDSIGLGTYRAFTAQAATSNLVIAASYDFNPTTSDYSSIITAALVHSPLIIVVLSDASSGARLLEQSFDMDLLHEGVTVFGNNYLATSTTIASMSTAAKASQVLKGFFGVRHFCESWMTTASGLRFLSRLESFIASTNNCSTSRTDDTGSFFFLKDHANSSNSSPYVCATLNVSAIFADPANNVNPIVAYVYDAVYAAGYALHNAFYVENSLNASGASMKAYLTSGSTVFNGLTGEVAFTPPAVSVDSGGNRVSGQQYSVLNYQSGLSYFASVGQYDIDSGVFTLCTSNQQGCSSPVFNTLGDSFPSDAPPPEVQSIGETAKIAIPIVISFYLLQWTILFVGSIVFRNSVTFKTAQIIAIWFVLSGLFLGCLRVLLTIFDLTSSLCKAEAFIGECSSELHLSLK